jgi:1-deoxy-D-xylulose-5-phosphate reductoisomerase
MKKKVIIFGSTGSIGKNLINILKKDKKNIDILILSAHDNYRDLLKQTKLFSVKNIIITNKVKFLKLKKLLFKKKINVFNNFNCIQAILKNNKVDYTMNAISGLDGLEPTLKVIKYTKKIAIANKEALICGWSLIKKELQKNKTLFIPVDSEHFSIWSLIKKTSVKNIDKIFITASGGPFIKLPLKKFVNITLNMALKHPNWSMGKKISIDSATLMNKVFEIIEAKNIFNINYNKLNILIHPKSYVHALVKFNNGLTKFLVHDTNMRIPIFNSFYSNHEKKIKSKNLNFSILNNLEFKKVEQKRYPVIKILSLLPNKNSLFETVLVSANDSLVKLFMNNKIKFTDIAKYLLKILKSKEFIKYKQIYPSKLIQIKKLNNYVSLKINSLSI